jgi:hypothetical protein
MMPKQDSIESARCCDRAGGSPIPCPGCGERELVQAYVTTSLAFTRREGARCLVCGKRFIVSKEVFAGIRQPVLGEPYETLSDKYRYMGSLPMGRLHVAICLGGLMIGVMLGVMLGERFDQPALVAVFFPVTCLAWWFGRWLCPPSERVPGKCPTCRYDLRGSMGNMCPECGTSILPGDRKYRDEPHAPP